VGRRRPPIQLGLALAPALTRCLSPCALPQAQIPPACLRGTFFLFKRTQQKRRNPATSSRPASPTSNPATPKAFHSSQPPQQSSNLPSINNRNQRPSIGQQRAPGGPRLPKSVRSFFDFRDAAIDSWRLMILFPASELTSPAHSVHSLTVLLPRSISHLNSPSCSLQVGRVAPLPLNVEFQFSEREDKIRDHKKS
jgi:hypothetical protein